MKSSITKLILGFVMVFAGFYQSKAQVDTLCNPNENKTLFSELYLAYGTTTNGYTNAHTTTVTFGQPLISTSTLTSQNYRANFGLWTRYLLPPQPPVLIASQGDYKDRVKLQWNVNPLSPTATEFVILRDGSFLANVDAEISEYLDFNVQAGEYYNYSIKARNSFGLGSENLSVGFVNPNGVVTGVVTSNSNNPVPGVEVRLTPLTGASVAFDGINDQMCVSYDSEFPTNAFTVSAYVKLGANNNAGIIDWGSSINKNWWITTTSTAQGKGYVFNIGTGSSSESLTYIIPNLPANPDLPNQWHQITMVYNGTAMSVMVDGEFVGTKPATISRVKNLLNIGSKIGSTGFFKGNIDDVRIYNRPLTQSEVKATKNRSVSKSETGLVAYWKMDEGIGQKVFDITSHATNANLYGGATFSNDIPEVYNAGVTDVTGYYIIDGINYANTESFRATPVKNFEYNSAVEFNAADKSYGNLTNYDIPDTATVEVLFYPFDLKSRQTILSKDALFELYIDNSTLFIKLNGNGSPTNLGAITAKYYHAAMAIDNTHNTAKVYLEGALKSTVSFTGASDWAAGNPWLLGTNSTDVATGKFFTGLVDEVAIYKTALPQTEIQRHFVTGIPKDSTTALIYSYFDLNEGADTKVYDYATLGFGGTVPREGTLTKANWSNNVRRPESLAHEFEPNVRVVNLNKSNTAIGNTDFKDVSTVNISGYVRFANTFCFEDQVEIKVNGQSAFPQILTDANGKWSADFEPGSTVRLTASYKDHVFSPNLMEFRKLQSPKAGILFLDNTKRNITVQVAGGACKSPIITSQYYAVVSVKTLDGCFEKRDTLRNAAGTHTFSNLPARAFNVNVVYYGIQAAKDQFDLQGKLLDLRDAETGHADFIYYAPLQVESTPIISAFACSPIPVLNMAQSSTIRVKAYEDYFGVKCYSQNATVLIKNGITGLPDSTNHLTNGFFDYTFFTGEVNTTPPYTKNLEIKASVGTREGVLSPPLTAIVLGEKSRGGNTYTSISSPIIVDVLRDPPGDQSYAWREEGTTSCVEYSTSVIKNFGHNEGFFVSVGPKFETKIFGISGLEVDVVAESTNKWTKNKSISNNVYDQVCFSNNAIISTSASDDFVGADGDIYMGTTVNLVWGMSDLLEWDANNCTVKMTPKLSVSNDKFNSTFIYTAHYIKTVIMPELLRLSQIPTITKQDSLDYVRNNKAWARILKEEEDRKVFSYNVANKILTLDAGASYQESTTIERNSAKTYNYSSEVEFESENSIGLLIADVGGHFNFGFNYSSTSEGSKTVNNTSTSTYGFFIGDDDTNDAHAVGIRYPLSVPTPAYNFTNSDFTAITNAVNNQNDNYVYSLEESNNNTISSQHHNFTLPIFVPDNYSAPIFTLYAGTTSCPYEGGRARERVNISSNVSQQINVPANTQAVYTLSLGNESPSEETRTYFVRLVNESNPDGAILKINGQPITGTPIPFSVKYNQPITATLTLDRGSIKYNYDGIRIAYYSECEFDAAAAADDPLYATNTGSGNQYKFYQEISFDTHFIEPCSPVDISFPLQDWVVTPASLNLLDITLSEYNKADANLDKILVQYRPVGGDGAWTNITTIPKANLTAVTTQYQWNTTLFKDGIYEIRAVAQCTNPNLAPGISTVIRGTLERLPPELVGVPQPADGVWDAGDEISITFNESIDCDKLVKADVAGNNTIGLYDATTNALVDATFSCVGNKIVIVPNINPKDFENRTFRVIISGKEYDDAKIAINPNHQRAALRDKAGNMIPTSIKWEFFVNQNNLEWVGTDIIETNTVLQPFSVKRQIRNTGGTITSFTMQNVPSWLTVSPATGTLNPGQLADVTFTFQQDLLIGDYLATVNMVSSKGAEPLSIDYRVRCAPPVYTVSNPSEFEGSMNMVIDLSIFGVTSTDPSDIIIAKIGGQVRGVGKVAYYKNLPDDKLKWLTFMTIYGNVADIDKPIEFHIWDGDKCNEYVEILENYTYQESALIGSPLDPTPVHVLNLVKKCIPLNKGWNWVSFNIDLGVGNNRVTNVMASLVHKPNTIIKEYDGASTFELGQWLGFVDQISPTKRYMINVAEKDTVCLKGSPYTSTAFPIAINTNWNWIGYVPSTGMTVTQAMRGLTPLNGDIIKSQTLFAQYVAGVGWIGNLSFLEPQKGYMLKISNPGTLVYNTSTTGNGFNGGDFEDEKGFVPKFSEKNLFAQANLETPLTDDFTKYQETMNVVGSVNGIEIDKDDELRAYINGKLVGSNKSIVFDKKARLFFQTIYFDAEQNVSFKIYKADRKKEYELDKTVLFKPETYTGLVENPIVFNVISSNLAPIVISIPDQVITSPVAVFPNVSVANAVSSQTANCANFAFNSILPSGTTTKPKCISPTGFEGNMTGVMKVVYNEHANIANIDDVITFLDPTTQSVLGCATFNTTFSLFNYTVKGGISATETPVDIRYYSGQMHKTFLVKSGVLYKNNKVQGSFTTPYTINVSPISLTMTNGVITPVLNDPTFVGQFGVTVFALNCPGFSDGQTNFNFQRNAAAALPVRLISFEGKSTDLGNELTWKTSSEQNFSHYEVQRSNGSSNLFEAIGTVKGASNSKENLTYEFLDELNMSLGSGMVPGANSSLITHNSSLNYYRLKMIDLDGKTDFSKIIAIDNSPEKDAVGNFYPNPTTGKTYIEIVTQEKANWNITLYDVTGKIIKTDTHLMQKGKNKVTFENLSKGVNFVRFENGLKSEIRKVVQE